MTCQSIWTQLFSKTTIMLYNFHSLFSSVTHLLSLDRYAWMVLGRQTKSRKLPIGSITSLSSVPYVHASSPHGVTAFQRSSFHIKSRMSAIGMLRGGQKCTDKFEKLYWWKYEGYKLGLWHKAARYITNVLTLQGSPYNRFKRDLASHRWTTWLIIDRPADTLSAVLTRGLLL